MFFQSSESKARHAFIDASLENTLEQLSKPAVIEAIFPSVASLHCAIISNILYVPDVRHSELKLPSKLDNKVPVLAIQPGESIKVDPRVRLQTHIQSEETIKRLKQWSRSEGEALKFARNIGANGVAAQMPFIIEGSSNVKATVTSTLLAASLESHRLGKNNTRHFLGRPVMMLMYDPVEPRMTPSTIDHEIEHVRQQIFQPVRRYDTPEDIKTGRLRDELGAYASQSWFIHGLAASGYEPLPNEALDYTVNSEGQVLSTAAAINNRRQETNAGRKDDFFPNGTLRKALEEIGLDSIYQ